MKKTLRNRFISLLLCIAMLAALLPSQAIYAALDAADQTPNADIIRELELSYQLKGETSYMVLESPYRIADSTAVKSYRAVCSFKLEDNVDALSGSPARTMKSGDYYYINLPDEFDITSATGGTVPGNDGRAIANYTFETDSQGASRIKVVFTDYVDDLDEYEIHGSLKFDFTLDLSDVAEGTKTTIYIPIDSGSGINLEVTKPVPPITKPTTLVKTAASYSDATRELVWTVTMGPDTAVFGGCVFTDYIDTSVMTLVSLTHGRVSLTNGTDYTYDSATGKITYIIPAGRDGADYKNIVIKTKVLSSVYEKLTATIINNTANLSGGDGYVDINSNESTKKITPNWLGKSGTVYQGNKIKWTITANTTNQNMYDAVITDNLQADVILDTSTLMMGSAVVSVYTGSHTPSSDSEIYALHTQNADGTSVLRIYLPRGQSNASTAKRTFTFVTDVVSPESVTSANPTYNNTAFLEGKYAGDGGGIGTIPAVNITTSGVAVPFVSIDKSHIALTADDKRSGTITWTITAASNVSDYGKSTVVDTLPANQEYIADEIYWGTVKINETTVPSAVISNDGRKLTITFNTPNALAEQQKFTVKTRILTEIYGTNLNQSFSNSAKAELYNSDPIATVIATATDNDSITVKNTVIAKSVSAYDGNTTKSGENPRIEFNITINSNLMQLNDVVVADNLASVLTEFKKDSESSYSSVNGVKWTYVEGSLKITKTVGSRDSLNLTSVASAAIYANDVLTISFGSGTEVNDSYTITFTAELDISQNEIFKENGTIRCKGNIADIAASGLKAGVISTPPTGYSTEISNEILSKSGIHQVAEQQALWTIKINQHRVSLKNSKIVDILPAGLTLDPTMIKLYTNVIAADGSFMSAADAQTKGTAVDFDYTYLPAEDSGMEGRYVLTIVLPDNQTEYMLIFATDIDSSLLGKTITNSAYYAGDGEAESNNDSAVLTFAKTAGGGSVRKSSVTVYKTDKDSGAALDGAIFTLNWLRGGDPDDSVFVRNLTSYNGSAIFRGLTRGETYTVTETKAPDGYIIDDNTPVKITVPSGGTTEAAPVVVNFENSAIKTGSWTPEAIKTLQGKDIIRKFTFALTDGSTTLMTGTTDTELANGDYSVKFAMSEGINAEGITNFTNSHIFAADDPEGTVYLAAVKTFCMNETTAPLPGYGIDPSVFTLTVKAYNVKGNDKLKITVEDINGKILSDDSGRFTASSIPVFTNKYNAAGQITLSAEKILNGHMLDKDQFTFEMYENNMLIQTVKNNAGSLTAANIYSGSIVFDTITYDESDVGQKTYRIVEKNTAAPGYTYDQSYYDVTVNITDNDDGTLICTVSGITKTTDGTAKPASAVSFENIYTASDIAVTLNARKILTGRIIEDGQFTFILQRVDSEGNPLAGTYEANNISGNAVFDELIFTQEDIGITYYYTVTEKNDGNPGYTCDNTEYTVKIVIADNNDGTLTAIKTLTTDGATAQGIIFRNSYSASGSVQITASKELEGRSIFAGQFAFALRQVSGSGDPTEGTEIFAFNGKDGSITFPRIEYSETDAGNTYYYNVSEIRGSVGGYTYDGTVYTVMVIVTDNGDGTLDINQAIAAPKENNGIVFRNVYITEDTETSFTVFKYLSGRVLEDQQFTFVLTGITDDGNTRTEIQRVKNAGTGFAVFDSIRYTQADIGKTYYYQITELNEAAPGYSYDSVVYSVRVDILDNGNGTLTALKTIYRNGIPALWFVFGNEYTATDTSLQLTAEKHLEGQEINAGLFSYTLSLKGENGNADTLLSDAVNDENGNISFDPLVYTQKDIGKTYIYTVAEVNDSKAGYEYDYTVYTVTVNVIDNGDGTLRTEYIITAGSGDDETQVDSMVFSNVYKAEGYVAFNADKILNGKKLTAGMFEFTLLDSDGNVIETVKNDAGGLIEFGRIYYNQDQLGEYNYVIHEENGNIKNIDYDRSVYYITVKVSDNGDGTLGTEIITVKEKSGTKHEADTIEFVNTYNELLIPGTGTAVKTEPMTAAALVSGAALISLVLKKKKKDDLN